MKRAIWIGALAILAFAVILLARLPASWLSGALPPEMTCGQISGTLWNGACSTLSVRGAPLGDLRWQLHALPLLTGKVASLAQLDGPAGSVTSEVEVRSDHDITARNLRANINMDPALLPQAPATLRGHARFNLSLLRIEHERIAALEGQIDVRDLEQRGAQNGALGDYVLTFPAARASARGGEPIGDVRSVKGPFDVEGTLRLTREPGFELQGVVAAGPDAPPDIVQQLKYLGAPDSRGRRPFSVAGTF
jgi:general secretion pathway protein N